MSPFWDEHKVEKKIPHNIQFLKIIEKVHMKEEIWIASFVVPRLSNTPWKFKKDLLNNYTTLHLVNCLKLHVTHFRLFNMKHSWRYRCSFCDLPFDIRLKGKLSCEPYKVFSEASLMVLICVQRVHKNQKSFWYHVIHGGIMSTVISEMEENLINVNSSVSSVRLWPSKRRMRHTWMTVEIYETA